jgi:hypothetical protein
MKNNIPYNRDVLLLDLRENVIEVSFDKINGQPRIMRCTLMKDFLPENYIEQLDERFHHKNPNIIAVWDLDNKGWKAFRIDSVKMVQSLDPLLFK